MNCKQAHRCTALSFAIACLVVTAAMAQAYQVGDTVQARPTGNEWVTGRVVKVDLRNNSYIIHFDNYILPEARVSTANVRAGGGAAGQQNNVQAAHNPNNNGAGGAAQQIQPAPQAQQQANAAPQAPAGGQAGQFEENIRQKYLGSASGDQHITVTFQTFTMTGPQPYQDAYEGHVNMEHIIGGPGATVQAYKIQTRFIVDTFYSGSGAHNINTIEGPYVGFTDKNGQVQTRAAGGGTNTTKYVPGP